MVRAAIIGFALIAGATSAGADPVVDAKTSIYQSANGAFDAMWKDVKIRSGAETDHISEAQMRKIARLIFVNWSFGQCAGFVPSNVYRSWDAKLEALTASPVRELTRAAISNVSHDARRDGAGMGFLDDMTTEARQAYCSVEIEAVRQVIDEL